MLATAKRNIAQNDGVTKTRSSGCGKTAIRSVRATPADPIPENAATAQPDTRRVRSARQPIVTKASASTSRTRPDRTPEPAVLSHTRLMVSGTTPAPSGASSGPGTAWFPGPCPPTGAAPAASIARPAVSITSRPTFRRVSAAPRNTREHTAVTPTPPAIPACTKNNGNDLAATNDNPNDTPFRARPARYAGSRRTRVTPDGAGTAFVTGPGAGGTGGTPATAAATPTGT